MNSSLKLSHERLYVALGIVGLSLGAIALVTFVTGLPATPGDPVAQWCAAIGTLLCFSPLAYLAVKRSGLTQHPRAWFVLHVLCVLGGCVFIAIHVASGNWLSPPGLILGVLVFLVAQGCIAYLIITPSLTTLFGRRGDGFINPDHDADQQRREQLRVIIKAKRLLLKRLDPKADEGTFSPNLYHWLSHPFLSFRYQQLAGAEANVIGARRKASRALSMWRQLHMAITLVFIFGALAHIVVVLFFAGYVANGGVINWWYITAWGRS